MQTMFIALFAVALVFFSFFVSAAISCVDHALRGAWPPLGSILMGALCFALFLVSFAGAGFYLYEREREEGRIMERIELYEMILRFRRPSAHSGEAKPIRRPDPPA
ncbi:MAG: hypothetical protein OXT69_02715 [Candidatus Poribacteria bacterium]|nr:hypothetical protein [Candidatus Poribacteria bacterium]